MVRIFTTMCDHKDGCVKQYHCAYSIFPLSCLALEFSIIIDRAVGECGYVRDVADGQKDIDKWMVKLEMENLLNPELIQDDPFFKFIRAHKNEEYQAVSLKK